MLAVAFDQVPDHIRQGVDAGVAVFLAVGLNLHLLRELVDRSGEFLQTPAKRLEATVHPEHLFREPFDKALGFTETVVHKNLCCQQVPLAVAELIEHGFHLVKTLVIRIARSIHQYTSLRQSALFSACA